MDENEGDVPRGALGLKDRAALRDDRYRRWLWGTRLCMVAGVAVAFAVGAELGVTHAQTTENYIDGTLTMLPVTLGVYTRAIMHVRLKAALVGTRVSVTSHYGRFNLKRDPISSEKESVRLGGRLFLLGTSFLFFPVLAASL